MKIIIEMEDTSIEESNELMIKISDLLDSSEEKYNLILEKQERKI